MMKSRWRGLAHARWGTWLLLAGMMVVGFQLRAIPGLVTDSWFAYDAAFHARMTQRALNGELGERDPLRFHPVGIDITHHQPGGLYQLTAITPRLMAGVGWDLSTTIRVTTALLGALTVIPLFFLTARVWRSRWAGWGGALCLAVLPAHVTRTAASVYRFDALGTLLIACHVLAVVVALASSASHREGGGHDHPGRRVMAWIAPGLTLLLLFGVWRASVAVLAADALILLLVAGAGTAGRAVTAVALSVAGGALAAIVYPYVRASDLLLSRSVVPALWLLLATAGIALAPVRPVRRGVMVVLALLVSIVITVLLPARPFDTGEGVAVRALLARYGLGEVDPFVMRLYGYVQELSFPGPGLFVGDSYFSGVGALALVGLVVAGIRLAGSGGRKRVTPEGLVVGALVVIWVGGTLFFDRNKVFAAIPVAVLAGGVVTLSTGSRLRQIVGALIALGAIVFTAAESRRLAQDLGRDVDPEGRTVCQWIRRLPPDAALLTDWGNGYLVQTYGRRATATDGHLEVPINRERIALASHALVSSDEGELAAFCRERDIDHVLLQFGWRWLPFVYERLAGDDVLRGEQISLPPDVTPTTIYRLLEDPESLTEFEAVLRVGPYRILRILPPS